MSWYESNNLIVAHFLDGIRQGELNGRDHHENNYSIVTHNLKVMRQSEFDEIIIKP